MYGEEMEPGQELSEAGRVTAGEATGLGARTGWGREEEGQATIPGTTTGKGVNLIGDAWGMTGSRYPGDLEFKRGWTGLGCGVMGWRVTLLLPSGLEAGIQDTPPTPMGWPSKKLPFNRGIWKG